ncbi:hypothetical protein V5O48_004645 [Marasmius crinis-equi]|uniref:Uncharacterized protein n=1 Tax=Marasmius crinis-equi TaxID=585013 RepID=A0ABR3FPW2_9AGAR
MPEPSRLEQAFQDAIAKAKAAQLRRNNKQPNARSMKDRLVNCGKWFRRHTHPRITLEAAVYEGLKKEGNQLIGDTDEPMQDLPAEVQEAKDNYATNCADAFDKFIEKKPLFGDFLDHCAAKDDGEGLLQVVNLVNGCAQQVLYDDNNHLKSAMHKLLSPDPFTGFSRVQHLHPASKEDRGVKNELICKYFMTREDMIAFKEGDANVQRGLIQKYCAPNFKLTADDLPVFLYNVDIIDRDKMNVGLLKAQILIRSAQYILTGPTTYGQPARVRPAVPLTARGDNAHIMRITAITPDFIFYVCCVVQFAMSSVRSWSEWDGAFSLHEFWDQLQFNFYDQCEAWQHDVLRLWNRTVFGAPNGRVDAPVRIRQPNPNSDSNRLRRQRDKERAAEAEAAAAVAAAGDGV